MARAALKLSRAKDTRRALVKGLATSLVMSEKVTTTRPKAKVLVPYFERLVSLAKKGDLTARRRVRSLTATDEAADKLVKDLAKRFSQRSGGYTRLKPAGYRVSDNAQLATVTLTEQPGPATKPEPKAATVAKKPATKPVVKDSVKKVKK